MADWLFFAVQLLLLTTIVVGMPIYLAKNYFLGSQMYRQVFKFRRYVGMPRAWLRHTLIWGGMTLCQGGALTTGFALFINPHLSSDAAKLSAFMLVLGVLICLQVVKTRSAAIIEVAKARGCKIWFNKKYGRRKK